MRILYFSRAYTTHDRRFLEAISEGNFDVRFLRLESDTTVYEQRPLPPNVEEVKWAGGRGPSRDPREWLELMPELDATVARLRPSLIHAGPVSSCGFMTALLRFHPFLLMSWGSDLLVDAHRSSLWRWLTTYALSAADTFFCDSKTVLRQAEQLVPIAGDRVLMFPWGVDAEMFRPGDDNGIRERLGWRTQRVVVTTRAWEPLYRTELLLESFRIAHETDPDLRLLMLSTGTLRPSVERFIADHHLEEVVHCPGQVPEGELPSYLRAADAYVSAAAADGTSISLLQAMAVGVPPIVSDNSSNREWIASGKNGWLPCGTAAEFASAMIEATQLTSQQRLEIASKNRLLIEQRANWSRNVGQLLRSYERLEQR